MFEKFEELYTTGETEGTITENDYCYTLSYNGEEYYTSPTYEHSHYLREELSKADWDKKKLPVILDNYKYYYTLLMEFYRYITRYNNHSRNTHLNWGVSIPSKKSETNILQQIRYSRIEDALYERDYLVENNWDYDLLVEQINDKDNPYYTVNLPPYPQRKIRNLRVRETHMEELTAIRKLLMENNQITKKSICEQLDLTDANIRNWLKNYNTKWSYFRKTVLNGEDPFEHLQLERHIYSPDLSMPSESQYMKYIMLKYYNHRLRYCVSYNRKRYGCYASRNIAIEVVKELTKVDWDKEELNNICERLGVPNHHSRKNIYINTNSDSYSIRKKIDGKIINYGSYTDYDFAVVIRDLLEKYGWDKRLLSALKSEAEQIILTKNKGVC